MRQEAGLQPQPEFKNFKIAACWSTVRALNSSTNLKATREVLFRVTIPFFTLKTELHIHQNVDYVWRQHTKVPIRVERILNVHSFQIYRTVLDHHLVRVEKRIPRTIRITEFDIKSSMGIEFLYISELFWGPIQTQKRLLWTRSRKERICWVKLIVWITTKFFRRGRHTWQKHQA